MNIFEQFCSKMNIFEQNCSKLLQFSPPSFLSLFDFKPPPTLPPPFSHPNSQSFLWAFPVRPKDSPLHPLLLPLPFQAQPNLPPIYTSPKTSFPHPLFPLPSSSSPLSWSPPNRQNPTSDTIHIYSQICEYMWIVSLKMMILLKIFVFNLPSPTNWVFPPKSVGGSVGLLQTLPASPVCRLPTIGRLSQMRGSPRRKQWPIPPQIGIDSAGSALIGALSLQNLPLPLCFITLISKCNKTKGEGGFFLGNWEV